MRCPLPIPGPGLHLSRKAEASPPRLGLENPLPLHFLPRSMPVVFVLTAPTFTTPALSSSEPHTYLRSHVGTTQAPDSGKCFSTAQVGCFYCPEPDPLLLSQGLSNPVNISTFSISTAIPGLSHHPPHWTPCSILEASNPFSTQGPQRPSEM